MQRIPPEPELLHRPRPEILHHHVGDLQQAMQDRQILLLLQIERDGLLAAVDGGEIQRLPVAERPIGARIIPAWWLYLNHPRAKLVQQQRAVGAGENARQIQDDRAPHRAWQEPRISRLGMVGHC